MTTFREELRLMIYRLDYDTPKSYSSLFIDSASSLNVDVVKMYYLSFGKWLSDYLIK